MKIKAKNNNDGFAYIRYPKGIAVLRSVDKESCNCMALSLHYWKDNLSSYFGIEYRDTFNPKKWVDLDTWIEITKESYMEHYEQVQKRISLAIA